MEEWRDIELYPNYQVSNLGNVRSVTHIDSMGRVKKGQNKNLKKHPKGYLVVVGHTRQKEVNNQNLEGDVS